MIKNNQVSTIISENCHELQNATLVTSDNYEYNVNKAALSAKSNYLKSFFEKDVNDRSFSENPTDKFLLPDISHQALEPILHWVHHDEFLVNDDGVISEIDNILIVLKSAELLGLAGMSTVCQEWLQNKMEPNNVLDLLKFAEDYSLKKLRKAAWDYLMIHMPHVVKGHKWCWVSKRRLPSSRSANTLPVGETSGLSVEANKRFLTTDVINVSEKKGMDGDDAQENIMKTEKDRFVNLVESDSEEGSDIEIIFAENNDAFDKEFVPSHYNIEKEDDSTMENHLKGNQEYHENTGESNGEEIRDFNLEEDKNDHHNIDVENIDMKCELKCPVCHILPRSAPVYQCPLGHIVCEECLPQLTSCPICYIYYKTPHCRNIIAEKWLEIMDRGCRYEVIGCDFSTKQSARLIEHELSCDFKPCINTRPREEKTVTDARIWYIEILHWIYYSCIFICPILSIIFFIAGAPLMAYIIVSVFYKF